MILFKTTAVKTSNPTYFLQLHGFFYLEDGGSRFL
jgi:hypothetical protein